MPDRRVIRQREDRRYRPTEKLCREDLRPNEADRQNVPNARRSLAKERIRQVPMRTGGLIRPNRAARCLQFSLYRLLTRSEAEAAATTTTTTEATTAEPATT